jgi:DNA helicase-2/ATP-dependent DNA helicase PcrA
MLEENKKKEYNHIASPGFHPSDPDEIEEGMKVEHQKFGLGRIKKIEGGIHNRIASVDFEQAGFKKIMLHFAKLMIIKEEVG